MSILVSDRDGCRVITLDRPPVNVLDLAAIRALGDALAPPLDGRRDLKAVVLRSAVPGTFSAGVDVADHTRERAPAMLEAFHAVIRRLGAIPQGTIAAVDGRCLGGACELAACCDVVLASPRATFALPEIDVGCFPPVAAALFPRLIGRAAYEMVLTGAALTAEEASRVGLASRVVEDVDEEAERVARRLAGKSAAVLAIARRALRGGAEPWPEALAASEGLYREELLRTADAEEGVRAFLEKRAPRWVDA